MLLARPPGGRQKAYSLMAVLQRHFLHDQKVVRKTSPSFGRSARSGSAATSRTNRTVLQELDARVLELNQHFPSDDGTQQGQLLRLPPFSSTGHDSRVAAADSDWAAKLEAFETALRDDIACAAASADVPELPHDFQPPAAEPSRTDDLSLAAVSKPLSAGSDRPIAAGTPKVNQSRKAKEAASKSNQPQPKVTAAKPVGTAKVKERLGAPNNGKARSASKMELVISRMARTFSHEVEPVEIGDKSAESVGVGTSRLHLEDDDEMSESTHLGNKSQLSNDSPEASKTTPQSVSFAQQLRQELMCYIDMCVRTGWINRAHSTLSWYAYHATSSRRFSGVIDVQAFNCLLRGWAQKGDLKMAQSTLAVMTSNSVRPDHRSFTYLLLALAKQPGNANFGDLDKLLAQMEKFGVSLNQIVAVDNLQEDDRAAMLKLLHLKDPSIFFKEMDILPYKNVLVDHLNSVPVDLGARVNPIADLLSPEEQAECLKEQINTESGCYAVVDSVAPLSPERPGGDSGQGSTKVMHMRQQLDQAKSQWRALLTTSFQRIVGLERKKQEEGVTVCMYPFLTALPEDVYIELMLREVDQIAVTSEKYSASLSEINSLFGHHVYRKFMALNRIEQRLHEKMADAYGRYIKSFFGDKQLLDHRKEWLSLCSDPAIMAPVESVWPYHILLRLGQTLLELILNNVKIDACMFSSRKESQLIPAFYLIYRNHPKLKRLTREIKPHPLLVRLYAEAHVKQLHFDDTMLPMLVPPQPWSTPAKGGYLFSNVGLVRRQTSGRTGSSSAADGLNSGPAHGDNQQILPLLEGINVVSACPWRVNKPVLDAMLTLFRNGGSQKLDIAVPASAAAPLPKFSHGMSNHEKAEVNRQRQLLKQEHANLHGQWCSQLYKLSIARKYADRIFWLPHNIDFRGRTYPCPPHFSHTGDDVSRSLLQFAHVKKLGAKGLDWLKIHAVNLTGLKKRSTLADRLAYADQCMDDILDSARRPLDGRKWWQESEEPWQTLACCQEILRALESGDPSNYGSAFPVHQDGSCNGLQHYASLGRDQAGAESVNVAPAQVPQDVYTEVANLVEAERIKDAAAGIAIAEALNGVVKRKVIKQTVMTTVYGVTRYGAREQIHRQLTDLEGFPEDLIFEASNYLRDKTFSCLQQMFTSTKEIQDWLTLSAYLIARKCGEPVDWITPVGLQVVQPYMKHHTSKPVPNDQKQRNAFPPNFIHSLDSTHMILTALNCQRQGVTFVSVHDCFWTHACDVDAMNKICREQFAKMYSHPILENLAEHLMSKHGSKNAFLRKVLRRLPQRGTFDVSTVVNSQYFFS